MECPPDMAASFLRKWRDASTLLLVSLRGDARFDISTAGVILGCDPEVGLAISLMALTLSDEGVEISRGTGEILAVLKDATFEYVDPREARSDLREASEAITVCVLNVKLHSPNAPDVLLTLTEVKEEAFARFVQE